MELWVFPGLVVIGFLIASYFDLKYREIPPLLSYSLILFGLGGHALLSVLEQNTLFITQSALLCILCFFFAFSLYRLGIWAGGDVKLFAALGALLPMFNTLPMFPFFALTAGLLAVFPFAIIYLSFHFVKQKKIRQHVKHEFILWLKRAFIAPFYWVTSLFIAGFVGLHWTVAFAAAFPISLAMFKAKMYAIPIVAGFSLALFITQPFGFIFTILGIFIISAIVFLGIASFRSLREHVLREEVKVSKLEEGMIPVVTSRLEKPGITKLARGLTNNEIKKLRQGNVKTIVVRKSLPFTPVLTLGLIILLVLYA
jgi:preflagellin peptidase FlaK